MRLSVLALLWVVLGFSFAEDKDKIDKMDRRILDELRRGTGLLCSITFTEAVYLPKGKGFKLMKKVADGTIYVLFEKEGEKIVRRLTACDVVVAVPTPK